MIYFITLYIIQHMEILPTSTLDTCVVYIVYTVGLHKIKHFIFTFETLPSITCNNIYYEVLDVCWSIIFSSISWMSLTIFVQQIPNIVHLYMVCILNIVPVIWKWQLYVPYYVVVFKTIVFSINSQYSMPRKILVSTVNFNINHVQHLYVNFFLISHSNRIYMQ